MRLCTSGFCSALTISRTDGCALRGTPDLSGLGRDWVTDCAAQLQLYNELQASMNAITDPLLVGVGPPRCHDGEPRCGHGHFGVVSP